MRIVSLLPSATEILFALGVGDQVVGVTFKCDHPAEAADRRTVVSSTAPDSGAGSPTTGQIDAWVREATERGEPLYRLDADALAELAPDLVITQDLCEVCAVPAGSLTDALARSRPPGSDQSDPTVLSLDPHTLDDVLASVLTVGRAVGRESEADELARELRARITRIMWRTMLRPRKPVLFLEWTDPAFVAGHWIPEMIEIAGGDPLLGRRGQRSVAVSWEEIRSTTPELIVVAPCGLNADEAQAEASRLRRDGMLPTGAQIVALDGNARWTRPGPRLVDGIEELADILHPPRRA